MRLRFATMVRLVLTATLLGSLLTGCGDRAELPEKGFVMGLALDEAPQGGIGLTVQIYKPSQSIVGRGKPSQSYINIETDDESVIEAVRDITLHLGRKAQWSHMRIILVGESLARKHSVVRLLDFLYRDHEPRLTTHLLVTKGAASHYLDTVPYIENSVSQQYYLSEKSSHQMTGKSVSANLLQLALQSRSPSAVALIPYLYERESLQKPAPTVAGAAVLVDGRMKEIIPSKLLEGVLLLANGYKSGIVEVPCSADPTGETMLQEDAVEVLSTKTAMTVRPAGDHLDLNFRVKAVTALSELACGLALTPKGGSGKLRLRIQKKMEQSMSESMDWLLQKRLDVVGAGNRLFERHTKLWREWKSGWPDRFARSAYEVHADVTILTSGTNVGKPVDKRTGES
ncbi:Ger(x)C family spore germination protein [Cohnella rhizosphaerae]|uniref:Ger(X)C family spore germination protein n=1 Tax=Cohnella rhizosphaerae TaxID=1457232 RepID=A0A9X4KR41_9BACL|nr:Ger(x)C family spore germination protein [Cohnella rhizosphaerae]MDG0809237.1 Ger(x)C family spore germination protein [Cohnella rhizosphaerae]